MTLFRDTDAAAAFIATASSRETSPEVMKALTFLARTEAEARDLWKGDGFGTICNFSDVVEIATGNGRIDTCDLFWAGMDLAQIINEGDLAITLATRIAAALFGQVVNAPSSVPSVNSMCRVYAIWFTPHRTVPITRP